MKKLEIQPVPLAYTPPQAAAAVGVGPDFFAEHIQPELRVIRRGRKVLIAVTELQSWLEENSQRPMIEEVAA